MSINLSDHWIETEGISGSYGFKHRDSALLNLNTGTVLIPDYKGTMVMLADAHYKITEPYKNIKAALKNKGALLEISEPN